MLKYTIRRILLMIPVLIGAVIIVFTINYMSALSPAVIILGDSASPELIAEVEADLGLDQPYLVQLFNYFKDLILHGDFGDSYIYTNMPVWNLIVSRMPVTIKVGLSSVCLSVIVGVPLGILAAVKQNSVFDYGATIGAIALNAIPSFWMAQMLMLFFAIKLKWLPLAGLGTWKHYILPIIASGMGGITMLIRMTRSSMLEVVRQDYIRTARAKGVSEKSVIWKHALKNALIPVATIIGMSLGTSMTGSVIAETIFNLPGLGLLMNSSISQKDYITLQGCVIVCAFMVTAMNLITDLAYAYIDPRIKAQYVKPKIKKAKKSAEAIGNG